MRRSCPKFFKSTMKPQLHQQQIFFLQRWTDTSSWCWVLVALWAKPRSVRLPVHADLQNYGLVWYIYIHISRVSGRRHKQIPPRSVRWQRSTLKVTHCYTATKLNQQRTLGVRQTAPLAKSLASYWITTTMNLVIWTRRLWSSDCKTFSYIWPVWY